MKEITKLEGHENTATIIEKQNEIIDVVNMLIVVHPKLEQRIQDRKTFNEAASLKD